MAHSLHFVWSPSEGIPIFNLFLIRYYSLMFLIAFSLGWLLMKKIFIREQEPIQHLDTLFVYTIVATLLGARLGHVIFYDWGYYKHHLIEILLPIRQNSNASILGISGWEFTGFSGLASHGAAIAIIISMYIISKKIKKKNILWILDRIVIPVSSGAIFVRIGNFFNSEILGDTTTSFLGIQFIQDTFSKREATALTQITDPKKAYHAIATDPQFANLLNLVPAKHPVQLYEAISYIFVFGTLYYMYWKTEARNQPGLLFGTFLVLLEV